MLEVCWRFGMRIGEYQALATGERALYNQYALLKMGEEARTPALRLDMARK